MQGMVMARSYTPYHPGLLTDLYHPDSAYVAWRAGRTDLTTFDLYARRAPFGGAYLLVAGLEMALEFVRSFHYNLEDIAFLQQIRDYDPAFLEYLSELRFTGEILAMPEGSREGILRGMYRVRPSNTKDSRMPRAQLLGSGAIRVHPRTGLAYVAPTLIYHYIEAHHYLPPRGLSKR